MARPAAAIRRHDAVSFAIDARAARIYDEALFLRYLRKLKAVAATTAPTGDDPCYRVRFSRATASARGRAILGRAVAQAGGMVASG